MELIELSDAAEPECDLCGGRGCSAVARSCLVRRLDSGTEAAEEVEVGVLLLVEAAERGLQGTKLRSAGVDERLITRLLVSLLPVTGAAAEVA